MMRQILFLTAVIAALVGVPALAETMPGPAEQRVASREGDLHFAVIRYIPNGIRSFQMASLMDRATRSRFVDFANRYRALRKEGPLGHERLI